MSVLLAYGTSKEAVIMSDSRGTYYDEEGNILGFEDDRQKIFKIADNFVIGSAGNGRSKNILENINTNKPNSSFYTQKNYTYENWLEFFAKRIKIFGIDKLSFSPFITIGINSDNKIRMDTFNNITCVFDPACPKENDFFSIIYLPPNVNPSFKDIFYNKIRKVSDEENYCKEVITYISQIDNTVGGNIQCFKVNI